MTQVLITRETCTHYMDKDNTNLKSLFQTMFITICFMLQLATVSSHDQKEASTSSTRGMECALTVTITTLQVIQ